MKNRLLNSIIILWTTITLIIMASNSLSFGAKEVLLKVRPVDPRDMLRGDYVILDFDISHAKNAYCAANEDFYINLKTIGKFAVAESYGKKEGSELFIKGKCKYSTIGVPVRNNGDNVIIFGIENYFVKEGTGRKIENFINSGDAYAKVKIDKNGKAKVIDIVKI